MLILVMSLTAALCPIEPAVHLAHEGRNGRTSWTTCAFHWILRLWHQRKQAPGQAQVTSGYLIHTPATELTIASH